MPRRRVFLQFEKYKRLMREGMKDGKMKLRRNSFEYMGGVGGTK